MSKPKILVITGTVRQGRAGLSIANWFLEEAKKTTDKADFELLDIATLDLPLFDAPAPPMYGHYNDLQKKVAELIGPADGFVIVTGEYNYSIPGALKNFLDYVFAEWRRKPVSFVGYGGAGGVRAIAHLVNVVSELGAVPLTGAGISSHVNQPWAAFDEEGNLKPEQIDNKVESQLNELLWYTQTLKEAREAKSSAPDYTG
ncbi:MAG TPA: NAD(P)H-dependent oxidoreductase [Candidatus Saccharimonadales bacterium]|nr:NAD(P)H-dependent oxidoreductase [Candidatus Saccharimonadales bacterium]